MFPDDDALWFPGFSDSVMRVYETDAEETIGGVGGTEVAALPPGMSGCAPPAYRMALRDKLRSPSAVSSIPWNTGCFRTRSLWKPIRGAQG